MLEKSKNNYVYFFTSDHGEDTERWDHGMVNTKTNEQYFIPYIIGPNNQKELCSFVEKLRSPSGWISALSNKFILLNMLGYKINQEYLDHEVSNDRVLHPNGEVYRWKENSLN